MLFVLFVLHFWLDNISHVVLPTVSLTLKVLNFWKVTWKWSGWISDSYCSSLKPLMISHGGSSAGSYLADHTSYIPSHCAIIRKLSCLLTHRTSKETLTIATAQNYIYQSTTMLTTSHPELSGCITTLTVCNGCKLLCSNGHLDRSRWPLLKNVLFPGQWLFCPVSDGSKWLSSYSKQL